MQLPLQITFRGFPESDAIKAYIETKAAKLDTFFDRIMGCRVVVDAPHQHRRHGRTFRVHIDVTVPGAEVVVGREPAEDLQHRDIYAAIDAAFDDAGRLLQDVARVRRGDVKERHRPQRGHVSKLFRDEGYGFLRTDEGQEVYFHKNSVLQHGFERLEPGTLVRFVEELGDKGPQASTVAVVR